MIWLTWRQQRLEALIGGALLALLAVFLLVTGLDMASTYQRLGVAACLTSHAPTCADVIEAFRSQYGALSGIVVWLTLLPLVFGVLLATPFVLELEQGTYRLVWTQGITRTRWVTLKLGLLVAAALLISLALTALLTWWQAPFVRLDGSFQPHVFDVEGTIPLAYTVFAVALGLGLGTVLCRTVPAVAISLIGFLVLRLGLESWVRPTYLPPVTTTLTTGGLKRSDWVLDDYFRDHLGHRVNMIDILRLCGVAHGSNAAGISGSCLQRHGIVSVVTYQPGDRFWLFQGIETAIFVGLAVGLLALTVWWVRERAA
jgi:hypothetical protein